jgi:DNA-binding Lrp family transcriptional regulator
MLDELDRTIVQEMAKGISSYEDLAAKCNVTRSTVYRRVIDLEKRGIITRQIRVRLNFEKLDLVTVHFGINVESKDEQRTIDALTKLADVKMVWRTYGAHNLVVIAFCTKGSEGKAIDRIREVFEGFNVKSFEACVGFDWEKMDMTPF